MTLIRRIILAAVLMAGLSPAFAQSPTPVPALPDTERRTSYSITSSTCACAVNFALYGDSTDYQNWVEVWLNGARVSYNDASLGWTITSPSGSLANLARPISNAVLTFNQVQTGTVQIVGARRPRRTSQVSENRGVAARDFNQAITDLVSQNRETWDKINDVSGRAVLAPPGETLTILAKASTRASQGACFDANGNLVACVSVPSSTFTAGNGIALTGVSPTTITNNIQASAPLVISGTNPLTVSCPTCNTAPATASPAVLLSTRSAATALDLHTYTVVRTGGYATAGDGGSATFKNVAAAPFLDSGITSGALTAGGSAYTNGTYFGVFLTGGTGTRVLANITVAGGAVTTVALTGTGGNGYTVGDVLSATAASIGGTGSGFTWTVSAISTATCSFTDSVGTRFQMIPESTINIRQCGAVGNYTQAGGDAAATNDQVATQNAINFATRGVGFVDAGGFSGNTVIVPTGAYLICGGLVVPSGVTFSGVNSSGSLLKQCDAEVSTRNFITLGDPTSHQSSFYNSVRHMTLFGANASVSGTVAMIYSNSQQQADAIVDVVMYPIYRGCVFTEIGYGGTQDFRVNNLYCVANSAVTPFGVSLNYPNAIQVIYGGTQFTSSGGWALPAIIVNTGALNVIRDTYCEGVVTCIQVNVPAVNGARTTVENVAGSGSVTNVLLRVGGTAVNQIKASGVMPNGATNAINNGGAVTTTPVLADTIF